MNMKANINHFLPIIIALAVFLFVFLFSTVFTWRDDRLKSKRYGKQGSLCCELLSKRFIWLISAMFWKLSYYICVLISFISSVTIVFISAEDNTSSTEILIFSIITSSLVLFEFVIKPQKNSVVYREAFCIVDEALNKYTFTNEEKELAKAISDGEKRINDSYRD